MKYICDYNGYWKYFDFLRDKMSPVSRLMATSLLGEAMEFLADKPDQETEEGVSQAIQEISDVWGNTRHYFKSDLEQFVAYNLLKQIPDFDWEVLLASLELESGLNDAVRIPAVLIEQFSQYFDPETKSVLISEGEKFTPNLKELVDSFPHCDYTITTMNDRYQFMLEKVFQGYKNVTIVVASIYEYEFLQDRFDLILSVPIFGSRLLVDRGQHFMCREHEMVAVENLLLHLNRGGRLAILLPARITFAGGSVKELRDFIQQMYKLESISQMPEGLLPWTNIRTYLLVIGSGSTDDISIRKYSPAGSVTGSGKKLIRRLEIEDETFVMLSELIEQGDWNIDKLFTDQDADWQKYMGVSRVALGEVATVFRGKNISRKSDNTGSVGVVNISNLREYDIDYDNLDHIEETDRKIMSYILETGDILVPARGTAVRTAIFEAQDYTCIASSNIVVIRPRQDMLNSTYLKMFLDSPLGGKLLASAQQGTTVINLSYKDMQHIEIPLPDIAKQREIAERYGTELKTYLETVRQAQTRWDAVRSELQDMI